LCSTATITSGFATDQVLVNFYAGSGVGPFIANPSGTATNGITVRMGTFNSATDADVEALGYNLLWVNNQFTVMTPSAGGTVTSEIASQAGSFSSDGSDDAFWTTSSASALNRQIWLVYSNDATLANSTAFGVASSTDADWDMPASYSGTATKILESLDININAFGTINGTSSTSSLRTASTPATYLYWDSNAGAGLGGSGTWSTSTSDTEWTTASGGDAADGPYAWGTTSSGNYEAGAGLTANFGGTAGTVTVSGTVQTHNGLSFDASSGSYVLDSGTINLAGSNAAANTITVASSETAYINSALTGSAGMTKAGAGTLTLNGTNTYTGSTTINAGTLQANAASALGSTTAITVNSGGSLLISATNAVNNSAAITLAGGTVAITGTTTDTVGALTLSASSVIDLSNASGARTLTFADSSAINWAGASLQIWNWNGTNMYGTSYGDGDRQIFFGSSASGLTQAQLDKISFYSGSGTGFIGNAFIRSTGEIAAIPEPEVYATAILLLLGLGINFYRRRQLAPALAA
jgi:autotransporter-associated beta strand protein